MKKAAILLAEGFEEVEAMTPVDLLRRAGIEVKLVSIDNAKTVKGAHNIEIMVDEQIKNIKAEELDLIILPGGMPGTKYLDASREVAAIVESVNKNNKFVAALCAAPSVLGHLGLLEGKKAVCYPGFEDELKGAEVLKETVVFDNNIITSRGMGTAMDFGLKLVELLADKNTAQQLGKGVIYG